VRKNTQFSHQDPDSVTNLPLCPEFKNERCLVRLKEGVSRKIQFLSVLKEEVGLIDYLSPRLQAAAKPSCPSGSAHCTAPADRRTGLKVKNPAAPAVRRLEEEDWT